LTISSQNAAAAAFGAERYVNKLRVAEAKQSGSFLFGSAPTIAGSVAAALIEFTTQFYGVPLPADCPKLLAWFARMSERPSMHPPKYPAEMLEISRHLQDAYKHLCLGVFAVVSGSLRKYGQVLWRCFEACSGARVRLSTRECKACGL